MSEEPAGRRAEAYFADSPLGLDVLARVRADLRDVERVEERTTKSQVAFRRRHGFAFLWRPAQHLRRPAAEVVLSIALGRRDDSPRWKEIVQPASRQWIHHLEVGDAGEIDGEVAAWLAEAAERAG